MVMVKNVDEDESRGGWRDKHSNVDRKMSKDEGHCKIVGFFGEG